MRRVLRLVLAVLVALSVAGLPVELAAGQKTVSVKGYTKKDGTYVPPYTRSAPGTKDSSTTTSTTTGTEKQAKKEKESKSTPAYVPISTTPARDSKGRFVRSESAKRAFMKETGYPKGRKGYVVDHIRPLACGGADAPSNMQWQTVEAAKAKDRVERDGCGVRP